MVTLEIVIFILLFSAIAAGILLYLTKKRPVRKLNTQHVPPSDTEYSSELTPEPSPQETEYLPEPPAEYGVDRLTALARDPYCVHMYWEISAAKKNYLEQIYGNWSNSVPILRVYSSLDPINLSKLFDVRINDYTNNWYLKVPDNAVLTFELARLYQDGRIVTVLRSNTVVTPRAYMSDKVDEQWLLVGENQMKLYRKIGVGNGPSSPDFYKPEPH